MFKCYVCGDPFTRQFSLKRHMKRKHTQSNVESKNENPKIHNFTENGLKLRHPFTMMVAASTGGGKTWLVKNLLKNREQWISPAPQRIVWIYGQWQPLYAEMQRIIRDIEFVKGIPVNIEDEQFLNPAIQNLIVIDDLMSEASNDKRICDLFTKGSHHRNLSVICLVQNLYYQGRESRTMSLNSQYLVLFNNPRDQQQIAVLARQMYPGQNEKFLSTYRMATSKPFGYLLIDLKPDTPNDKRLWLESESSEEEENDNIAFIKMANEIKEETEERFKAHVQKYQADGFTLKQAKEEAEMVMLPGDRQIMYKKYLTFLKKLLTFHKSELHRSIVRAVKEELDKSFDMTTAIRNVLRKRKMEIPDFVDTGEESSPEDSDNEGTDDNI